MGRNQSHHRGSCTVQLEYDLQEKCGRDYPPPPFFTELIDLAKNSDAKLQSLFGQGDDLRAVTFSVLDILPCPEAVTGHLLVYLPRRLVKRTIHTSPRM